jgi:tetratricopeptide (TPR) repeat protein
MSFANRLPPTSHTPRIAITGLQKIFSLLSLALALGLLCFSSLTHAQDSATSTVLERYGSLDVERTGATIDAELGRKMLRRGNTYLNLERYDEAIEEYRRALSADPNQAEALRNLANIYLFQENFAAAKPLLARFIALQTDASAALIAAVQTLGQLERNDGNFDAAIEYDLRAIALLPTDDSQVHVMANTYNNAGDSEKAIAIYEAASRAQPGNAFMYRSMGRILESQGRLEQALEAYRKAAETDPDSNFYANLVESLEKRLGSN